MSQTAIASSAAAHALALSQYGQHTQAASGEEGVFSTMLESAMASGSSTAAASESGAFSKLMETLIPMMLTSTMYSDFGSSTSMMLPMLMMMLLLGQYQSKGTSKSYLNSLLQAQEEEQAPILSRLNGQSGAEGSSEIICTPSG